MVEKVTRGQYYHNMMRFQLKGKLLHMSKKLVIEREGNKVFIYDLQELVFARQLKKVFFSIDSKYTFLGVKILDEKIELVFETPLRELITLETSLFSDRVNLPVFKSSYFEWLRKNYVYIISILLVVFVFVFQKVSTYEKWRKSNQEKEKRVKLRNFLEKHKQQVGEIN